jgi:cytochrome c55X
MRWSSAIRPLSPSLPAAALGLCLVGNQSAAGDLDPVRLANLVRQDCGSCHGLTLQGGLGKPLTPDRLAQWDRDQLIHIILDGVPGTPMPGWRPLLTEAEAGWIVKTLRQGTLR